MLWNPALDVDALLEEYYKLFYGPAALQAKAFWTLAEEATMARISDHPVKQFTRTETRAMIELLETGIALCPEGSVYKERLKKLYDETEPYCRQLANMTVDRPEMQFNFSNEILPLDGTLWPNAASREMVGKIGIPIDFKTQVLTAADKEGLAFTFVCHEENMDNLRESTKKHDSSVWSDDSVEIHISNQEGTKGFLVILSSAGVHYDAKWQDIDGEDDVNWNPQLLTKVTKHADKWIAQIKIPWGELGIIGNDISAMKGNLYRTHFHGRYESFAAYATTMEHHHRTPDMFVKLILNKQ